MNYEQTIKTPVSNEKAIRLMEAENKLVFLVDKKANKTDIKNAIEKLYGTKVLEVNTLITKGVKKAYVTLTSDVSAIDIATKVGMI